MRDLQLQLRKEEAVKKFVADLLKQRYARDYAIEMATERFFLKPATIERICWGDYDARRERDAQRAECARRGLPPPPRSNARQPDSPS